MNLSTVRVIKLLDRTVKMMMMAMKSLMDAVVDEKHNFLTMNSSAEAFSGLLDRCWHS